MRKESSTCAMSRSTIRRSNGRLSFESWPTFVTKDRLVYMSSIQYLPRTHLVLPFSLLQPLLGPPLVNSFFGFQLSNDVFSSDRPLRHITSKLLTLLPNSNSPPQIYSVGLAVRAPPFALALDLQ